MTSLNLGRRIPQSLLVLLGVSVVAFALIHLVPGDPARISLGPRAPEQAVLQARHSLGLDKPLITQYWDFISGAVHGNFGYSLIQHASVASILGPRIAPSLLLLAYATVLSIILAVPLGLYSALRRDRVPDHVIRVVTMVTFAMPSFWLALVLVELLALRGHVFPVSGYGGTIPDKLRDLTLPALTISLYLAPMLIRTLRSSVIDVLGSDFVEAARARGLSERRVITKHVLRNASIATVTVLAVNLGFLISGTVVVEVVFDIPGLGSLIVNAVEQRDFPLVSALTLIFGFIVIVVNLLADLAYAVIDPRVRQASAA
ncbi:MAG TPA: ABC transporter permease [Solirubrobacteraceae bacterium]|jgi:peptide/nickel transport system permease protein|nr:ABC transporter permease [Solirubrobacteraceae bacterium]